MIRRLWILSASFFMVNLSGQQGNISSYNLVTMNYRFTPNWFLLAEGELRGNSDFYYPDYYEYKVGIGYRIAPNHKPLIGIGRGGNYKNHSMQREELRIWFQDIYDFKAGRFKFENRFRAEKSWLYQPKENKNSQRVRLRYRLNISTPLNTEKVQPGTISANIHDEVFATTTASPVSFWNRIYGGLGYQVDKNVSISAGYMWQRDFAVKGNVDRHYLYTGLSINVSSPLVARKFVK